MESSGSVHQPPSSTATPDSGCRSVTASPPAPALRLVANVCTVCMLPISSTTHLYANRHSNRHAIRYANRHANPRHRSSARSDCSSGSSEGDAGTQSSSHYTLACGHRFHTACIGRWLDQHSTCPTCGLLVAAVTRLVISASQVPLPIDDDAHAHAQTQMMQQQQQQAQHQQQQSQGEHQVALYDSCVYDAIGWFLVATLWIALIAIGSSAVHV